VIDTGASSPSVDRDADDQRYVLAAMAARRARRNRPRRLVAGSALVLIAAGMAAAWGSSERSAAAANLREARIERLAVEQLVPQYQEALARGEQNPYAPVPDLVSRMEAYARDAGLDNPLPKAPSTGAPRGSLTETTVTVKNIQNRTLGPVIRWLDRVVDEIPGIEITLLQIIPNDRGWNVNVTFVKPTRL
jgi:hypothetical protein